MENRLKRTELKEIKDYPDYLVSKKGEIYSKKTNKYLKEKDNGNGYKNITIRNENGKKIFYIHRLVAMCFIPNLENKKTVNHKDGNKSNNSVENLEWMTYSENNKHNYDVLNKPKSRAYLGKFGKEHNRSVKIKQLDLNGKLIKTWFGASFASRETKIKGIRNCLCGISKTAGGYRWEYA